ncbi:MAG: hypothetical protein ACOVP4_11050 [Bacteriovoracaceae bacterium]
MKYWPFFLLFISPTILAQEIEKLTKTVVEVQNALPTKEGASIASDLEDKLAEEDCPISPEQDEIDAQSSLPLNLKRSGWKVLFEVKYNPIQKQESTHQIFNAWKGMGSFVENSLASRGRTLPQNLAEMNTLGAELSHENPNIGTPEVIRNAMIIRHLENSGTPDEMYSNYKNLISEMNTQDKLGLLTSIASYIPYNDDRASFFSSQNESTKGKISPFQIMRADTTGGICGDIHSTVAKFAEISGFEAFTIGYALNEGDFKDGGSQHVISAVVDPNDKDKVYLINYSTLQTNDLSEGQSLRLAPTNKQTGTGIIYRIFKNEGDAEAGKMQQIGVLPTSLRGFFDELTQKQYQLQKALPQNQNFTQNKISLIHEKEKVKERGSSTMFKQIGEEMTVYQGTTQEGEIWGVAVSTDKYKKIYNNNTGKLKTTKYFGATLSGSLLDNNASTPGPDMYFVYLKLTGAKIFHLIESPQFKFAGAIGYSFDAFGAMNKASGTMVSVDGNFETFAQVLAEYQKNNTNIKMAIKLDNTIALKDQNLMTDFSKYPENIRPFKPNASSAEVNLTQKIDDNTYATGSAQATLTNMGNRIMLSSGLIHNQTAVNLSYTGGIGSASLSDNALKNVNLINNSLGFDGFRLSASQGFSNKSRTFSGSAGGYLGITSFGIPNAGAGVKLDIGNGSKKKKYKSK